MSEVPVRFDKATRAGLYRVMELRRDIRHFRDGEVADATLARLLYAAQLAPSVGFSQPWGFVVVRDRETRARIRASFLRCRAAESARFPSERRKKYLSYKLEGIEESTLNVAWSPTSAIAARRSSAPPCSPRRYARACAAPCRTSGSPRAPRGWGSAGSASWSPP